VYWPKDDAWYPGTVTAFDATASGSGTSTGSDDMKSRGLHRVDYDDGESEVIDLSKEKVLYTDCYRLDCQEFTKAMYEIESYIVQTA
jgi:hypothetical protein